MSQSERKQKEIQIYVIRENSKWMKRENEENSNWPVAVYFNKNVMYASMRWFVFLLCLFPPSFTIWDAIITPLVSPLQSEEGQQDNIMEFWGEY